MVQQFIQEHPGAIAVVVATLFTLLSTLVGSYWAIVASRISRLEAADTVIGVRVGHLEVAVAEFKEHQQISDRSSTSAMSRLEKSLESIHLQMTTMHGENLDAHSVITERIARVEASIANGKISEIHSTLNRLSTIINRMVE